MPAFTAIAVAIVGAIGITGIAATILTAVIATGLAMVTSRLINGGSSGRSDAAAQADPGVRQQLAPSTEHKIPVLYGSAFVNGIITDARISSDNKTMTYVFTIAETTNQRAVFTASISGTTMTVTAGSSGVMQLGMTVTGTGVAANTVITEHLGGTYGGVGTYRVNNSQSVGSTVMSGSFPVTVEDIYFNDLRVEFDGVGANGHTALRGKKHVNADPLTASEDFIDDNLRDKINVWLWAGNSTSAKMITGTSGGSNYAPTAIDAYTISDLQWTNPANSEGQRMEGLIFCVLQLKYDREKGYTGLPTMTFKLKNALDNPAVVMYDLMTSDRYGGRVAGSTINAQSLGRWGNFCNESVSYTTIANVTTTQKRYTINGLIDTARPVKDNMDTVLLNGGAWMAYDVHTGQWRAIPKRVVQGYDTVLNFNDDNIIGGIQISATRLDDLYNIAEIEYFDRLVKDQRAYNTIELPDNLRNINEPDNSLRLSFDLVNSNVQAERLGNIELKQSRDDLMIEFSASHYGLQAQAGDVIKVENSLYGWQTPTFPGGKEFRVVRVIEQETEEGGVVAKITALEYNADVYTDENIQEFATSANIGIIPRDGSQNLLPPIIKIKDSNTGSGVPSFGIEITIPGGGPYDELQIYYAEGYDWAGNGADCQVRMQITGTEMLVFGLTGAGKLYAGGVDSTGATRPNSILSPINGGSVQAGTVVTAYGTGTGRTGSYVVNPNQTVPIYGLYNAKATVNDATFSGYISGTELTVTSVSSGTIKEQSLITGTGIQDGTIITAFSSGNNGGVGTYRVNLSQTAGSSGTPVAIISKKPYPALHEYQYLRSILPSPRDRGTGPGGQVLFNRESLLFDNEEIVTSIISTLPPNQENRKYFIKARLGIQGVYGPFSDINELDLEIPSIFWDPDSGLRTVAISILKQDFGYIRTPRSGLWQHRVTQTMDFGSLNKTYNNHLMDLGALQTENELTSTEDIEIFRWQDKMTGETS